LAYLLNIGYTGEYTLCPFVFFKVAIKKKGQVMKDTEKHNAPSAPAYWFQCLDRMELDRAITEVLGRRHADLCCLVDAVAATIAEVDAMECCDDANWRSLREASTGFTERLKQHLSDENHALLPHATGHSGPPTRQMIRRIRGEHTQLLEDIDALAEAFENLQHANFCNPDSVTKLAQAADEFANLESALNAEIFAEEIGILRRCATYRQIS